MRSLNSVQKCPWDADGFSLSRNSPSLTEPDGFLLCPRDLARWTQFTSSYHIPSVLSFHLHLQESFSCSVCVSSFLDFLAPVCTCAALASTVRVLLNSTWTYVSPVTSHERNWKEWSHRLLIATMLSLATRSGRACVTKTCLQEFCRIYSLCEPKEWNTKLWVSRVCVCETWSLECLGRKCRWKGT